MTETSQNKEVDNYMNINNKFLIYVEIENTSYPLT